MNIHRVIVGVDHGGYLLRERIVHRLKARGLEVIDRGVFSEESVDYPDIAAEVCTILLTQHYDLAVLACGTGIGISIAANKHAGIRCALIHDLFTAEMARAHNRANAIAFGGRVEYPVPVEALLDRFLDTSYQGGRHEQRIAKITGIERSSAATGQES